MVRKGWELPLARTDTNWKSMVWLLAVLNQNLLPDLLSLSFYPTVLVVTYVLKATIPDTVSQLLNCICIYKGVVLSETSTQKKERNKNLQNSLVRSRTEVFPITISSILEGCCFFSPLLLLSKQFFNPSDLYCLVFW